MQWQLSWNEELGRLLRHAGRHGEAALAFEAAAKLAHSLDRPEANLGWTLHRQARAREVLEVDQRATSLARELGDLRLEATALDNAGVAAEMRG